MSYRSLPFRCFPIGCAIAQVSPFFRRVTQYRRHLWFTVVPGWTLPADLSDSLSRETPCPSFPIRRGCCFGYRDRKSTRLNSSHVAISYAVFCLKKKNDRDEWTA